MIRFESSAKETHFRLAAEGRSLIYIRNRSGPRMLPCGTPVGKGREELFLLFNSTYCFLSVKYDLNHELAVPRMP